MSAHYDSTAHYFDALSISSLGSHDLIEQEFEQELNRSRDQREQSSVYRDQNSLIEGSSQTSRLEKIEKIEFYQRLQDLDELTEKFLSEKLEKKLQLQCEKNFYSDIEPKKIQEYEFKIPMTYCSNDVLVVEVTCIPNCMTDDTEFWIEEHSRTPMTHHSLECSLKKKRMLSDDKNVTSTIDFKVRADFYRIFYFCCCFCCFFFFFVFVFLFVFGVIFLVFFRCYFVVVIFFIAVISIIIIIIIIVFIMIIIIIIIIILFYSFFIFYFITHYYFQFFRIFFSPTIICSIHYTTARTHTYLQLPTESFPEFMS